MARPRRNVLMSDIHVDETRNVVVLRLKSEGDVSSLAVKLLNWYCKGCKRNARMGKE